MDEKTPVETGIAMPEDLSTATSAELADLKVAIAAKAAEMKEAANTTAADLEVIVALKDAMASVRAEEGVRTERAAEVESLVSEIGDGSDPVETIAEAEGAEGTEVVVEAEGTEVVAEAPIAETIAAALVAALQSMTPAPVAEPVAARAPIRTAARAAAPSLEIPAAGSNVTIVAAAAINNVEMGSHLDRDGLSIALHEKARMMSDSAGSGSKGALVASISPNAIRNDLRGVKGDEDIRAAWDKAHVAEALVASGGWCAPSETVYDFVCDFEAMPEMVDLPSITANRGGVRYPVSPLLGDVLGDITSGFTWTEADDIAAATPGGPTKPCFTIPCPDFEEVRLQAQGICVTAGNLTDRAYPELTNRYIDLVMAAHAHRMNGLTIAKMVAGSVAEAPTLDADLGATESVLGAIDFEIAKKRDQFFMAEDAVLEGVAPRWLRNVIRRDLARRGGVDFNQVTNAEISAYFSEIGARIQFVSDWQSLTGASVTYPGSVQIMLYPAGAHTKLDGGSIDLGVVRDSTLNSTNDYTAAWSEEFWAVLTRCFSVLLTIPICPTGLTGGPAAVACPTV